jgi:hypothetical protein
MVSNQGKNGFKKQVKMGFLWGLRNLGEEIALLQVNTGTKGEFFLLTFAFFSPKVPVEKSLKTEARPCP